MKSVAVLIDKDTGLGFSLSGVEHRLVGTPEELKEAMEAGVRNEAVKVLIVDEVLFKKLDEADIHLAEQRIRPLVLPVPTIRLREGVTSPEEYVARLIRRAIGYQIKIKR